MDVRGTHIFGHEHQRERGCWSLIFLFIVSYWQYDILMNTDRSGSTLSRMPGPSESADSLFYHNFRGVIREATQHFTSCYKILKWQIAADLFSVRSRWENGAGSIIRRRKDRPPCARLFVWTETGSDRVLEAVCWDWVIKTGMRSDQHPCYDCFCRTRPFLKSTLYPEFMTDIFLLQPEEGRPV